MARAYTIVYRQGADIKAFSNTTDNFDSLTYGQCVDNWMWAAAPTTNYGSTQDIYVGHNGIGVARGLIRFTGTGTHALMHEGMPREISANLYVYVKATSGTSSRAYAAYMLRNARRFIESESTWAIYETGNNWTTAGADSSASDHTTTDSGSGTVGAAGAYYAIDVSAAIASWTNDSSWSYVTGWRIHDADGETSGTFKQLGSSETITAAERPRLEITYKIRNGRKLGMWNAQNKSMGSSRGNW